MSHRITKKDKQASSFDGYLLRLNDARKLLAEYDISELHKKLFWDLLSKEIDEVINKQDELLQSANLGQPWTDEDDATMIKMLDGKRPTTWEEEKEITDNLVKIFRRPWRILKRKAHALNLDKSVDYWSNRDLR